MEHPASLKQIYILRKSSTKPQINRAIKHFSTLVDRNSTEMGALSAGCKGTCLLKSEGISMSELLQRC